MNERHPFWITPSEDPGVGGYLRRWLRLPWRARARALGYLGYRAYWAPAPPATRCRAGTADGHEMLRCPRPRLRGSNYCDRHTRGVAR